VTIEVTDSNRTLADATLVAEMRKPFDVLFEGLITNNSRAFSPMPLGLRGRPRLCALTPEIRQHLVVSGAGIGSIFTITPSSRVHPRRHFGSISFLHRTPSSTALFVIRPSLR